MKKFPFGWLETLFVCILVSATVTVKTTYAVDGDMDWTFAQPDLLTRSVSQTLGLSSSLSMVQQSDGKVVAAGSVRNHSRDSLEDTAVFRFDPVNLALDTTFGGGDGILSFDASGPFHPNQWDFAEAISLQTVGGNDDYILVGARGIDSPGHWDFVVARVTPDGDLDASFGPSGSGMVQIGIGSEHDIVSDLTVEDGIGNIAAVGRSTGGATDDFAIALLDPDGNLVNGFHSDGTLMIDFGSTWDSAYAVAFDSAGHIVVAGESEGSFALAKVDQTGALVGTFGSGGLLVPGIGGTIMDVACQGTDILVFGSEDQSLIFAKFDSTGSLVTDFGVGGSQVLDFGHAVEASRMVVDESGRIWGVGGTSDRYSVARLTSSGAVDQSFGTTVRSNPAQDPAGKVLIAGIDFDSALASHIADLVIEPSGTAVIGSRTAWGSPYALVRIQANGVIDPSLSQPGTGNGRLDPRMQVHALASAPDGDVIGAGISNYHIALLRMDRDGILDPSFGPGIFAGIDSNKAGTTGFDYLGRSADLDLPFDVVIQAADVDRNGKIVVAGGVGDSAGHPEDSLLVRFNADGSLDESFSQGDGDGVDGVLVMDVSPSGHTDGFDEVEALADGDLLALGRSTDAGSYNYYYLTLARFDEDGSLDTSFATADDGIEDVVGIYSLAVGDQTASDDPEELLVDEQGRILAVGSACFSATYEWAVVRYTAEGVPDPSFGVNGIWNYHFSGSVEDWAFDGVLQPDGRLVLSGFTKTGMHSVLTVARIDSSGDLDPSFGEEPGYTITNIQGYWMSSLDRQPDGKIVVAANSFQVLRFDDTGTLDPGFGVGGVVDHGDTMLEDVMILPGWKILVGGTGPNLIARLVNTDLGEPEIDIQRPAGNSIPDGSTDDLGSIAPGPVNLMYTVDNTAGTDCCVVSELIASGITNISNLSFDTEMPLTVHWGESNCFEISFDVDDEGWFGFDLDVINDDSDEGVYDILVSGEVPTETPTVTPSQTVTQTPTLTPTFTPTETPTETASPTNTPTNTATPTPSFSPTTTPTQIPSLTPTNSPSITPTQPPSFTPTPVVTHTPAHTPTHSPTPQNTHTQTPSHTPVPTCTPTPSNTTVPTFTPTIPPQPTETPGCTTTGVTLWMPAHEYHAGNPCACSATVCNAEGTVINDYPLWVILDVYGIYFFGPSFTELPDNYLVLYPQFQEGETVIEVLPRFDWPAGAGSAEGIMWYAALTDPAVTGLFGEMNTWEFGWN